MQNQIDNEQPTSQFPPLQCTLVKADADRVKEVAKFIALEPREWREDDTRVVFASADKEGQASNGMTG